MYPKPKWWAPCSACVRGITALTLRVQLVGAPSSRSSSLLPDPSFHAFRSGAQTHRLGSKNIEPMWTGEVFLTAHLHRDWTAHRDAHTSTLTHNDDDDDGREVWSCCASLLSVLQFGQNDISVLSSCTFVCPLKLLKQTTLNFAANTTPLCIIKIKGFID